MQREEKLSFPMERLCVAILLYNFYTKGLLLTKSELQICTDDEYIGEFSRLKFNSFTAKKYSHQ